MKHVVLICFAVLSIFIFADKSRATIYTLKNAQVGGATLASSWSTDVTGGTTGTNAGNFTTNTDIFIILAAQTATFTGTTAIGVGVTLQADGNIVVANAITVTINGTVTFSKTNATQVTTGGTGGFTLASGAIVKTVNINGLKVANGSIAAAAVGTLNAGATYEFNAAAAQALTGLPASIANLVISGGSASTKTLAVNTTVTTMLTVRANTILASGGLNLLPAAITLETLGGGTGSIISGAGTLTLGGTVLVNYTGSGAITTGATISMNIALSATRTINVGDDGTTTSVDLILSGIISGTGFGITKSTGTGTLQLSGVNTFTGVVTVNTGSVIGTTSAQALGTGAATLTLSGGTLVLRNATGLAFNRNVTVSASSSIKSDIAAPGAGVIHTLGTLTINASTLTIAGGDNINSGVAGITMGAVTQSATSTYVVTDVPGAVTQFSFAAFANGGFTPLFNGDGNVLQTGIMSGNGGLTFSATGTITLSQANTFIGNVSVNDGIVIATAAAGLGASIRTNAVTLSGGNLTLRNNTATSFGRNVTVTANSTITTERATAGTGAGAHTMGTLAINATTLTVQSSITVTGGTVGVTFGAVTQSATPTFTVTEPAGVINQLSFAAYANSGFSPIFNGDADVIQSGVWSGAAGLTYSGTGTILLSQANTFTGIITINSGNVIATVVAGLGAGTRANTINLTGGNLTLRANAAVAFGRNVTVNNTSSITTERLTAGAGAAVSHTLGTVSVANSAILSIIGGATVTSQTFGVIFGGVSLAATPTFTVINPSGATTQLTIPAFGNSGITPIFNGDGAVVQTGIWSGAAGLTYDGAGSITLSQANTFTGIVTVGNGSVIATVAGGLGAGTRANTVTMDGGALILRNATATNYGRNVALNSSSTITNDRGAAGAGVTHTLGTLLVVNAATLSVTGTASANSLTNTILFGAVTHLAAPIYTVVDGAVGTTLSIGTVNNGAFSTTFNGTGDVIQTGVFGPGSGGVTYGGTGNISLNQTNTFTGPFTLNSGNVVVTNASGLGATGSELIINGGSINSTALTTNSYQITLNGNFTFIGNASLVIPAGAITLTSDVQITTNANILTLNGPIAGSGFDLTKAGAATLNLGTQTATVANLVITAGTLVCTSGTMNVEGSFTNTGTFTHNSGTVVFNGAIPQTINTGGSSFSKLSIGNTTTSVYALSNITTAGVFSVFTSAGLDMTTFLLSVASVAHSGILSTQNTSGLPITAGLTWGGTVRYNSAAAQAIVSGNYNILNGTGGARLISAITIGIADTFIPGAGVYTLSSTGNTFDFNGTGAQTIPAFNYTNLTVSNDKATNATTFASGGTTRILAALTIPATNTTYVLTGSTVEYNGTTAQTVQPLNYDNLTIAGTRGGAAVTLSTTGTIGVAGVFTLTAATTTYTVANSTLDYNGGGAQTLCAPFTYFNLIVSNAGSKSITSGQVVTCRTLAIKDNAVITVPSFANSIVITTP
jgi:fibronectin-binding autotransporter adhesin